MLSKGARHDLRPEACIVVPGMPISFRRRLPLSCGTILLVMTTCAYLRAEPANVDDGWRRTAQGWALLSVEVVAFERNTPSSSLTIHPLLLAALQVSLVAAAYWRFPVKS